MCKLMFRVFLSVFLSSPLVALGWNNMCHSPVQLAAFMSQPKKSKQPSRASLKKSIRGITKAIQELEDELDDFEDELADSLNQAKLKDDPSNVASEIRSYIESGQDAWDCENKEQSFLSPPLFLFEILSDLLIPQAFGDHHAFSGR